ncbi:MAG: hypothetical protein KDJ52_13190, partial [Anaerolineae bacterium]|nr:hypothetical protein [Anaerolineae bacterium]
MRYAVKGLGLKILPKSNEFLFQIYSGTTLALEPRFFFNRRPARLIFGAQLGNMLTIVAKTRVLS